MPPAPNIQIPVEQRTDAYWSIVSDLVSLIDRTHSYQKVNETSESAQACDGDVVVLDDMRPAQTPETLLLSDCNLRLREALHFLLEARASRKRPQNGIVKGSDPERKAPNPADGALRGGRQNAG
jgi:hypothetical protein